MRKVLAATLASVFFTTLFATTAIAAPQQSDCAALNAGKGEGKFTGQISSTPTGSSMEVTYGDQTVVVRYSNSVKVCQGGQPGSFDALTRGASVSVFGPLRRNGKNIEIDAARIFVAGPPRAPRPSPEPARVTPELQSATKPGGDNYNAQPAMPSQVGQQSGPPTGISAKSLSPISMRQNSLPNSVILRGGTHAETMQPLHIVRTYAFADLRATPQVTLGEGRLGFRPMLNNDKALFNVAQRLHQLPRHVEVKEDRSEVSEVEQGLVIYHVLTYRILPRKCADANARAQLARAGVGCFERASASDRVAEFSRPGSPRYIASPEKRQQAISAYQRNSALAEADANKGIAELRKALANPSQRAAIAAQIGEAEAARMSTLPDDQLKEEIINSSVQHFEETLFVPKLESANYARPQHTLTIAASPPRLTPFRSSCARACRRTVRAPPIFRNS